LTAYDFNSRYEYVQRGDAVMRAVYVELLPTDPHTDSRKKGELSLLKTPK
jgi:hypothetical protein